MMAIVRSAQMFTSDKRPADWASNKLLAALAPETLQALSGRMQRVMLSPGEVLSELHGSAYFPIAGLSSLSVRFLDGFQATVGLVGFDGAVGAFVVNETVLSRVEAVVTIGGAALKIAAVELAAVIERAPELGARLQRFGDTLWAQAAQLAACNGHHGLVHRLARWLLMADERIAGSVIAVTQEALASALCVHRPSVTVAVGRLQRMGSITSSGGKICIVDRAALARSACECYVALQQQA